MSDSIILFQSRRVPRSPLPPSRLHLGQPQGDGAMPRWWRDEAARLEALGYGPPHTAASDYDLVRNVSMGRRIGQIAAGMGVPTEVLMKRWDALVGPLRTEAGHVPVEAQERLLRVLRHRAPAENPGEGSG